MGFCELIVGAVVFYERFQGVEGIKDRYFIVLCNGSPDVECFTTTTKSYPELKPKLAAEFCEIKQGECCLPKRCFIDLRQVYPFDDIQLGSRLRSKSVRHIGDLPQPILKRLYTAIEGCKSLSPIEKDRFLQSLDSVSS